MLVSDVFPIPLTVQPAVRRLVALGLLWSLCASTMSAVGQQVSATDVKAAFTISFLKFAVWPAGRMPSADSPYVVVVLNDEPLHRAIAAAAKAQNVDGRAISVRAVSSVDEARDAHLLFIGAAEERRLPALVRQLEGSPILTVGDTPGFGRAGVILNLFLADQRVQFEANTAAANRAGMTLRAQLLRLARIVG